MTDINKQKFLAELAQLLTFMYEEDRQDALLVYSGMFDEAEDEQALLQALVSPIRQAVLVARAYNATERKLSAHSETRGEVRDDSVPPDFLQAIFEIRAEAMARQAPRAEAQKADENQFSLFDQAAEEHAAAAVSAVTAPGEAHPAEPVEKAEAPAADELVEESAPAAEPDAEEAEEPDAEEAEEPAPAEEAEDEDEDAEDEDEHRFVTVVDGASSIKERTVRKPRVFLLILYILLAIPVTLVGIVLLLLPTLLSLSAAALLISVGIMAVSSVFGGFAVLADLLVVLGAALILLALGLLFLWLFIWFIGGAIGGLIRGVCALGRKWCYKEVPAV